MAVQRERPWQRTWHRPDMTSSCSSGSAQPVWRACGVYSSPLTRRRLAGLGLTDDDLARLIQAIPAMEVSTADGMARCRLEYPSPHQACGIDRVRLEQTLLEPDPQARRSRIRRRGGSRSRSRSVGPQADRVAGGRRVALEIPRRHRRRRTHVARGASGRCGQADRLVQARGADRTSGVRRSGGAHDRRQRLVHGHCASAGRARQSRPGDE